MYAEKKPDKFDPNETRLSKWLGLIDTLPKEFGYIKGLKDMITMELAEIPGARETGAVKFQCPITGLEFNGKYEFYAIRSCGHVLSAKGFKEMKASSCLICHKEFSENDKLVINGSEDEVKELWEKMIEEKVKVKDGSKISKKLKNGEVNVEEVRQLTGTKHSIEGNGMKSGASGSSKKFKAVNSTPANATKAVYASIFTSSKKSDFKETFTCRSLPLGRN